MKKLKEALLVVERLRSKILPTSLGRLPEFLSFDQIENLINDDRFDSILYFYYNEINSSLNCWLLKPHRSLVKFEKLDKIDSNSIDLDLEKFYDHLLRPFESEFGQSSNIIWIVYDERMFKLPFHLMRHRDKFFYERYEVNCVNSLKYLFKSSQTTSQIYTRKRITESGATFLPMKVVSSEEDMKKLLDRFSSASSRTQNKSEQFDLLLLLVNPDNKGNLYLFKINIT